MSYWNARQRLKTEEGPIADAFEDVTVVFVDLVDWVTCPLTEAGFVRIVSKPAAIDLLSDWANTRRG